MKQPLNILFSLLIESQKKKKLQEKKKLLREYHITHQDFNQKVSTALSGIRGIKLEMGNNYASIYCPRDSAAKILRDLKTKGVICFYAHPVNDPASIVLLANDMVLQKVLQKYPDALQGFVRYGV